MTTLITGASSGIGQALALACAARGERLFLCGRDRARLDAVAAACRTHGVPVDTRVLDVTDEAAVRDWIDACERTAPLDRVFANAGVATGAEIEPNIRRTFAVNVGGTVNVVLSALAAIRARRTAHKRPPHLVLTASIAGYGPLKSCPSYAATKSCVKTWGLALRGQLRAEDIRVSVVCPGFVRSRITDRNTCPMPFFMEADKAARLILRRVDRNIGLIAFPWPLRFAIWWLSTLPFWLNDLINRLLPSNFKKDEPPAP